LTGSDWFSQGQDALDDDVAAAVPVVWDAAAPAAGESATDATGNASAKVADAASVRLRLLRRRLLLWNHLAAGNGLMRANDYSSRSARRDQAARARGLHAR
jgi:hypothetical protein